MRMLLGIFLLCLSSPAFANKELKTAELELRAGEKLLVLLHDSNSVENSIDFSLGGKIIQNEAGLGDRFVAFDAGTKTVFVHAQDLDKDGVNEVFVRLLYMPMGVMRVFKWNEKDKKFYRMVFTKKQESGLPLPIRAPVRLQPDGSVRFQEAQSRKEYLIKWNGKDYELPAVPAQ